jgi:hypothetical protein
VWQCGGRCVLDWKAFRSDEMTAMAEATSIPEGDRRRVANYIGFSDDKYEIANGPKHPQGSMRIRFRIDRVTRQRARSLCGMPEPIEDEKYEPIPEFLDTARTVNRDF